MIPRHFRLMLALGILLLLCSTNALPQAERRDVVYLKNGFVLVGTILAHNDNGLLRMRASDGRLLLIPINEIGQVAKEGDSGPPPQTVVIPQTFTPSRLVDPVIFVGATIPMGPFGSVDGDYAGFAKTGFIVGYEYQCIFANSIYFAPGISYAVLQIDQTAYRQRTTLPSGIRLSTTAWTFLTPSVAFGYGKPYGSVRYYIAGHVGFCISNTPRFSLTDGVTEVKQDSDLGRSLALGVVAGIKTEFMINLALRYYYSKPHYDLTEVTPTVHYLKDFDQPIQQFQVVIGVAL